MTPVLAVGALAGATVLLGGVGGGDLVSKRIPSCSKLTTCSVRRQLWPPISDAMGCHGMDSNGADSHGPHFGGPEFHGPGSDRAGMTGQI